MDKTQFRVEMGVRFKIKLKMAYKTINFIYPENLRPIFEQNEVT